MNPEIRSPLAPAPARFGGDAPAACAWLKAPLGVLSATVLFAVVPGADAQSGSASFQATASVDKACTISTPPTLGFGTYDPGAATPLAATTNFSIECTSGTSYSIGLGAGTGPGASVSNRRMTSASSAPGSNTLVYGLYKDASYTVSWDDSASASGYTGTGGSQAITIHGRIPGNQFSASPATDYADTITMTLTY